MSSAAQTVEVLLVEDSRDDADLMGEALRESALEVRLEHVEDGEAALLYLRRQGAYATMPPPDLILLDMQLPKVNGDEVLEELEKDPELRLIPVVVFGDLKKKDYDLDIISEPKPGDQEGFADLVGRIEQFWLDRARRVPSQ